MINNPPYDNNATQSEKKKILKNDTYFSRAQATIGEELGGRFKPLSKATVVGASPSPVPKQPEGSPWHSDPTGVEPPLGFDVNAMTPTGTPVEVQASITAELQKAMEAGSKLPRKADLLPDDPPVLKRRV